MRPGLLSLLASGSALCVAAACLSLDDRQVTSDSLLNEPGAGGTSASGGTSPTAPSDAGISLAPSGNDVEGSGGTRQVPGMNGAATTGSAGAGVQGEEPAADAGRIEPSADAASPPLPVPPPPSPPPVEPTPAEPTPVDEEVGFDDVFPILVTACGGCHGANAAGNRPRFAQGGDEAASFTATQATSQGETVSTRIVIRAVELRNMPPTCGGAALGTGSCLGTEEAALLQAWVDQGSPP